MALKAKKPKAKKVKIKASTVVLDNGFLQAVCSCGWKMPEAVAQTSGVNSAIIVCAQAIDAHMVSHKEEKK